jgi:hypothetical protein
MKQRPHWLSAQSAGAYDGAAPAQAHGMIRGRRVGANVTFEGSQRSAMIAHFSQKPPARKAPLQNPLRHKIIG